MKRTFLCDLIAKVSFALLLTGCGGANDTTPAVVYEGTTLVVDGVRYDRVFDVRLCPSQAQTPSLAHVCDSDPTSPQEYAQGQVMITFRPDAEAQAQAEVARFGLSVISKSQFPTPTSTFWVLTVPSLFEKQWVKAMKANPVLNNASVVFFLSAQSTTN